MGHNKYFKEFHSSYSATNQKTGRAWENTRMEMNTLNRNSHIHENIVIFYKLEIITESALGIGTHFLKNKRIF